MLPASDKKTTKPIQLMKKGDVFTATDRENHPHPIVFLEVSSEGKFNACILSTKPTQGNVKMSENYFLKQDAKGNEYTVMFNNSYLVPGRIFEKEDLWLSSMEPQGRLTECGIKFVEEHTRGTNSEYHPVAIKRVYKSE